MNPKLETQSCGSCFQIRVSYQDIQTIGAYHGTKHTSIGPDLSSKLSISELGEPAMSEPVGTGAWLLLDKVCLT